MKRLAILSLLFCLLAGCGGGGGGGGTPTPTTTPVTFAVLWPTRTRIINAPGSALSARITLANADPISGDFSATFDRDGNLGSHTQTYTTSTSAKVGTYPLTVRFYDQLAGAGDLVAVGTASVTLAPDGSGIGNVAVTNEITQVSVDVDQILLIGEVKQLTFTARDKQGHIAAVTPGSAHWSQLAGTSIQLTADGVATAIEAGSSPVRVAVDGVQSTAMDITVSAPPAFANPGFEVPALATNDWKEPPRPQALWGGTGNFGIANGNGAWGRGGHSGNQYGFIQMDASFHQTVQLVTGKTYTMSLWIARRNGGFGADVGEDIKVEVEGVQILAPTAPNGDATWRRVTSQPFTATKRNNHFVISGVWTSGQDNTTLIDDMAIDLAE